MIQRSPEMFTVAYALSRLGEAGPQGRERPPAFLGVRRWNEAYDLFYSPMGEGREPQSFRASLKNARDAFDAWGSTQRTGWRTLDGSPPTPTGQIKRTLDEWGPRPDDDLKRFVLSILAAASMVDHSWRSVRARLERTTRAVVGQSGKEQRRFLKNKELRCLDLEKALDALMDRQGNRCAQTGVWFVEADVALRASLDRIDSDGHYADGSMDDGPHNLQLVTHWYNMAKGVGTDADMRRLLFVHATGRGSRQTEETQTEPLVSPPSSFHVPPVSSTGETPDHGERNQ